MKSERLKLFEQGLDECNALLCRFPDSRALQSIKKQIEFLIGLEKGTEHDVARLREITIGVLTAREVEPLDEDVAEVFYKIAGEATRL
jgi:hypothetical protein